VEILARNHGDGETVLPGGWTVQWTDGARLLGRDGVGGVITSGAGENAAHFAVERTRDGRLRPGELRRVAWMRFDADTEVTLHVEDD
jgi:hypothetical protein